MDIVIVMFLVWACLSCVIEGNYKNLTFITVIFLLSMWFIVSRKNLTPEITYYNISNLEINNRVYTQVTQNNYNVNKLTGCIADPDTQFLRKTDHNQWSYGIFHFLVREVKYDLVDKDKINLDSTIE